MSRKKKIIAILIVAIVGTVIFWKRDLIKQKLGLNKKSEPEENQDKLPEPPNNGGGSTSYRECTEFPYKKGCKGKMVQNIQTVLNKFYGEKLKVDGYFGPLTETALERAGYGNSLEKEEVLKFLKK
ncbi:MAG: hypothetical protein C0594_04730 [Marinilabiliales bacterium]|nr:MAG: hypothetical protein C0594_04730 [Marinilabiliales bacterium]